MTRLYFESRTGTAEVMGWERAWLGGIADDIAMSLLDLGNEMHADRIKSLIRPGHYMISWRSDGWLGNGWRIAMETALRMLSTSTDHVLEWKGHGINGWHLLLNTALLAGGDAVKLAARLHAQSELHAWVDGPDRAWMADMIENAQDAGVFRRYVKGKRYNAPNEEISVKSGWDQVISLLREDDTGPVVTHYSVTESFPGQHVTDLDDRAWNRLTVDERWTESVDSLRSGRWSRTWSGLQLKPDDWEFFRIGHCLTVFDLLADDYADRLDKAIEEGGL